MQPMESFLESGRPKFADFVSQISSLPSDLPPPLPFDTLPPGSESSASLQALHAHLKRNLHRIGSVMQALDSLTGLQSLRVPGEKAGWLAQRTTGLKAWKRRWVVLKVLNQSINSFNPPICILFLISIILSSLGSSINVV